MKIRDGVLRIGENRSFVPSDRRVDAARFEVQVAEIGQRRRDSSRPYSSAAAKSSAAESSRSSPTLATPRLFSRKACSRPVPGAAPKRLTRGAPSARARRAQNRGDRAPRARGGAATAARRKANRRQNRNTCRYVHARRRYALSRGVRAVRRSVDRRAGGRCGRRDRRATTTCSTSCGAASGPTIRPLAGAPGMVLRIEPIARALDRILAAAPAQERRAIVVPSPGRRAVPASRRAAFFGACSGSSSFAGITRASTSGWPHSIRSQEYSLGDFVLTGGEIPALAMMDATVRLLPGVLAAGFAEPRIVLRRAARLP